MKKVISFPVIISTILPMFILQPFIKAQENSLPDTVYIWDGSGVNNLEFVMRDNNVDVPGLFAIENDELKFTKTEVGYFRTKESFSNFQLHAEWKWPEDVEKGNSGILIYTQNDTVWPQCVQVQLKRDNAGDIIAMNTFVAEATGKPDNITVKLHDSNEKPIGEWNTCNISCSGDSLEVHINGELQNKVTGIKTTSGTIGFQLEGKPIGFRNIYLTKKNKE